MNCQDKSQADVRDERLKCEPLVSIVTPFYNTREFIADCIESVVGQTYRRWNYILVDNCSTDGSEEIAKEYAARYPEKIRLVRTKEFLTQVQNYNFAISQISPESKYCKMIQADDWIFSDCVHRMVNVAEMHPDVGIVAAYELEGNEVRLDGLPYPDQEVSGKAACRLYFLRDTYLFGTPTSLLLRSEIVRQRNPFYDERYAPFEDGHACFEILRGWNFGFVHQVLTFTRRDNESILNRLRAFELVPFLRFSMLVSHGRNYLTTGEYGRCYRKAEREYLLLLAKAACARHRRERAFWEFHRKALASIGISLNWRLLAKWIPRALIEKAWNSFWAYWDRESVPDSNEKPEVQSKAAVPGR